MHPISRSVEVIRLPHCFKLPHYETDGAAAADSYAAIDKPVYIEPGDSAVIPLGFKIHVPDGYMLTVLSRSGLAAKHNIQIGNCPGVVDSDYRGEVGAIVYNAKITCCSNPYEPFTVNPGDRVCQVALVPVRRIIWEEVAELTETDRGAGGFGSTGISA